MHALICVRRAPILTGCELRCELRLRLCGLCAAGLFDSFRFLVRKDASASGNSPSKPADDQFGKGDV